MTLGSDSTHKPRAAPPAAFRDQATGCGSTITAARLSGAVRNAEVGQHMPPRQRAAAPAAEGFDKAVAYEGIPEGCTNAGPSFYGSRVGY